jgi:putative two-component system response regulator
MSERTESFRSDAREAFPLPEGAGPDRMERDSLHALRELACLDDPALAAHLRSTARLSLALARAAGVDDGTAERVWYGASLHDIGKIGVAHSILAKVEELDEMEIEEVRNHTVLGHGILSRVDGPLYRVAARIALSHHERWDGHGYPHGIAGADIPLEVRIVTIADVYDCVTAGRPYRPPIGREEAAAELREHAGTQFDPELVPLFLREVLPDGPADRRSPG